MVHEIDRLMDPEEAAYVVAADPVEPVVPVVGPAEVNLGHDRALERGRAASGRRGEHLAAKKDAASAASRAARQDETPLVRITTQIGLGSGNGTRAIDSNVPAPKTRRPRPQQLTHIPFDTEVSVGGSQTLTQEAGLYTNTAGRTLSLPNRDVTEHIGDAVRDVRFNPDLQALVAEADFYNLSQPSSIGSDHGLVFSQGKPTQREIAEEQVERFETTLARREASDSPLSE